MWEARKCSVSNQRDPESSMPSGRRNTEHMHGPVQYLLTIYRLGKWPQCRKDLLGWDEEGGRRREEQVIHYKTLGNVL